MLPNTPYQEEIEALSPLLANADKRMPYNVEDSYFEALPHLILAQLDLPAPAMAVPEAYFESFPEAILQKIHHNEAVAELEEVAPTLNTISKDGPYSVPIGYFEQLKPSLDLAQPAGLVRRIVANRPAWTWAAAAAFLISAGVLTSLLFNRPTTALTPMALQSEMISDSTDTLTGLAAFATVDDSELATYATQNLDANPGSETAVYLTVPENFQTALESFSTDDLKAHLNTITLPTKNG